MKGLSPLRATWLLAGSILLLAEPLHAMPLEGGYARQADRSQRPGFTRMPSGSKPYYYGGYRYYRYDGAYYTPYMYQGRTAYVQVDAFGGTPAPPPPAASIDVDFQ